MNIIFSFIKPFISILVILPIFAHSYTPSSVQNRNLEYPAIVELTDPEKLINDVKKKFEEVKDYRVDIKVNVDVDFMKVPDSKAKLLFKYPDKVSIKSEGFSMIPKEGMNFSPSSFFSGDYTSIFEKEEIYNGYKTAVVKVIPLGGDKDVVLSTIWIDINSKVIRKIESTTKTKGTFLITLNYDEKNIKYSLPSEMVFSFEIGKANISGLLDNKKSKSKDGDKQKQENPNGKQGIVRIYYSNYIVNQGIDIKEFEKSDKK